MSVLSGPVSVLELRFLVLDDRREVFTDVLGADSPLLPRDVGRRVAVYRCSCGIEGCGVVAPVIIVSPDGRRVTWTDFRDYVGVFTGPAEPDIARFEGRPHRRIRDLHFDRSQYVACLG